MLSKTKVYAGLSAQRSDVQALLPGARFAPPVRRGDVLDDIDAGVRCILILDGLFHQDLSVSPSEILDALNRGVCVFGASSMGALRAAELETYGMVGVGQIFEYIRKEDAFRDDFLGQVFYEGLPRLQESSVTYVEFEINLQKLLDNGEISRRGYQRLSRLYADLHYADRNFRELAALVRRDCRSPGPMLRAAKRALTMPRPKHRDARTALRALSRSRIHVARINKILTHPLNRSRARGYRPNGGEKVGARRPEPELGATYSPADLLSALERSEPVVYRENGNRSARPRDVLRNLERLMPLVGATRVGEISQLADHGMPVYQSTRPMPFGHPSYGQNTGSQGKGRTEEQAKLSCLAETVEGFCLEPRNDQLIRATYGSLRAHHAVADPRQFTTAIGVRPVRVHEPLMWTDVLCLEHRTSVLVPAELVFFDFFPADYQTRTVFPCSTNGAGAGATYLEAAIHALYECIESHYEALLESGAIRPYRVRHEVKVNGVGRGLEIRLYTGLLSRTKNLPFIICEAETCDMAFVGSGCCSNVDTAIARAVSETLQTISTTYSGSREDLDDDDHDEADWDAEDHSPRSISYSELNSRVVSRGFDDLRSEFRFLIRWLHDAGFPVTYIANLTRRGIDFPVVKALLPGMLAPRELRQCSDVSSEDARRLTYGID